MRKCFYALAAILILSATSTYARTNVWIKSLRSCGNWVEQRKTDDINLVGTRSWLLGFLSGLAVGFNKDFLEGIDDDQIDLWMDNYCKANPLKSLSTAGQYLATELIKQKKLK